MRYELKSFLERTNKEEDTKKILSEIDSIVQITKEGPWLAGGALRKIILNQKPDTDFDYFFQSESQLEEYRKEYTNQIKTESDLNITLEIDKKKVQFIKKIYSQQPEGIIDQFDYTICQLAYDGIDLISGEYALWDIARKRLVLHRLTFGTSSVRRMIKYTNQGFYVCSGTITDILEKVSKHPELIQGEIEYID